MKSILSTLTVAPAVAPAPLFNPETSKPTEAPRSVRLGLSVSWPQTGSAA
jgi:hypothetical protein